VPAATEPAELEQDEAPVAEAVDSAEPEDSAEPAEAEASAQR
jgi:hypothetical protein